MAEPDLSPEILALARAIREGAVRLPSGPGLPPSDVPTGLDARLIREAVEGVFRSGGALDARQIDDRIDRAITERIVDRRIPTTDDMRAVAKEVATALFKDLASKMEGDIRPFLTLAQIESTVFDILTDIGLPADTKEERKATKAFMEAMFRGRKLRERISGGLIDETVKALIVQAVAGGMLAAVGAAVWKAMSSGGSHP